MQKIEEIETENHEKLTDKEKVITIQVVEEIEQNTDLKQRLIRAMRAGANQVLQDLLDNSLYGILFSVISAYYGLEDLEEEINQTNH